MRQPVRKPNLASGRPTFDEELALELLAEKWRPHIDSTEPVDKQQVIDTVKALYAACQLKEPRVVVVPSPAVMAIASSIVATMPSSDSYISGYPHRIAELKEFFFTYDGKYASCPYGKVSQAILQEIRRHSPLHEPGRQQLTDGYHSPEDTFLHFNAISCFPERHQLQEIHRQIHLAVSAACNNGSASTDNDGNGLGSAIHPELQDDSPAVTFDGGILKPLDPIDVLLAALNKDYPHAAHVPLKRILQGRLSRKYGMVISEKDSLFLQDALHNVFGLSDHPESQAWIATHLAGGFRIYHKDFCIVSDRPERLHFDERGRFHCEDAPAILWRDGSCLYFWHGVAIPPRLHYAIDAPQSVSVHAIQSEINSELRRFLISRFGEKEYFQAFGATIMDTRPDDHPITGLRTARLLVRKEPARLGGIELMVFVDLLNSTPEPDGSRKRYLLRVDPNAYNGEAARNVHAAAASTWRHADGSLVFADWRDYVPQLES
jgi:hypothetical protein